MKDWLQLIIPIVITVIGIVITWLFCKRIQNPLPVRIREGLEEELRKCMKNAIKLVFLGISHAKLKDYIREVLEKASPLPWKKVEIYFANSEWGKLYDNDFSNSLIKSVNGILGQFEPNKVREYLPQLESVDFYQCQIPLSPTGSLFNMDDSTQNTNGFVVFSFRFQDTESAFTLPVHSSSKNKLIRYWCKTFNDYYNEITNQSQCFYSYKVKEAYAWDESVDAWTKFESTFSVYCDIMKKLIEFAEIPEEGNVLDIGCGTGQTSNLLASKLSSGFLLLLDSSPQMVFKAMQTLGRSYEDRIGFIVGDARNARMLYGKFEKTKFDFIVSNISFHSLINTTHTVRTIANAWKEVIKEDGKVAISLHNQMVELRRPPDWENWKDPLRNHLIQQAKQANIPVSNTEFIKLREKDIINEFGRAGFTLEKKDIYYFERTMLDRIAMWQAPAVYRSLFPDAPPTKVKDLLNNIPDNIKTQETMPTIVLFLLFKNGNFPLTCAPIS